MTPGFPSAAFPRGLMGQAGFLHHDIMTRLLLISLIFSLNTRFITLPVQQANV
ncbi:MAG: hypothetical protein KGY41_00075 [Desulfovermiculus sp.]|nr:hypothetical protein [Desulfovermiculus sp.]